jgi:hypothetical protein
MYICMACILTSLYSIWYPDDRRKQQKHLKVKVKVTLVQALRLCTGRTAFRGSRGIALPSASHPGRSLPPGKTRYPFYRRLDGLQDQSGQVRIISSPLGFDPRTVQPVASRYTDYATRPTQKHVAIPKQRIVVFDGP